MPRSLQPGADYASTVAEELNTDPAVLREALGAGAKAVFELHGIARSLIVAIEETDPAGFDHTQRDFSDWMHRHGVRVGLTFGQLDQPPPGDQPRGDKARPLWTYSEPVLHMAGAKPALRPAVAHLANLLISLTRWLGLHGKPGLGVCRLAECGKVYVKPRSDARYCSVQHRNAARYQDASELQLQRV